MGLRTLDYLVIFLYLVGVTLLGVILGRRQRSPRDYFLGNRAIPWWASALSIVATETSTLTFIGAPALAYAGDLTFFQLTLGYILGRVVVAGLLLPAYFGGELFTAYELLKVRFGPLAQRATSALFLVTRALADGVRLFATALVLQVVSGLGALEASGLILLVTLYYTFRGGVAAVVWTDVVQFVIYLGGAVLVAEFLLVRLPGGWEVALAEAGRVGKLRWLDLEVNPSTTYTLWAGLLGGGFLSLASHGTDQLMVQRLLAVRSLRDGQRAVVASGFLVATQFLLFLLIGTLLFSFYQHFPPTTPFEKPDAVLPYFIGRELPTGVAGLLVAAILAAAMSTLSSSLNAMASATVHDFYQPYLRPGQPEGHYLRVGRLVTLGWAGVLVGVAFLAQGWGAVLEVGLTIASFTYGALLGVFLLGLLVPGMRERTALVGMAGGLITMAVVQQLTPLAWTWYVLVGTMATMGTGLIIQFGRRAPKGGLPP